MKTFLLLSTLLFTNIFFAQEYTVVEKDIEVTSHFYNSCILELNSGNTILLQMEPRIEGFLLSVFDNQHNLRVSDKIRPEGIKDINELYVIDFIELNQKAVLFYKGHVGDIENIYKMEINQFSGEQKTTICYSFKENKDYYVRNHFFFKVIENKKQTLYTIIAGSTNDNVTYDLSITTCNSVTNQVLLKQTKKLNDYFQLELLDAVMDEENLYLLLNRKFKAKDAETKGVFKITEVNYIPENRIYAMQINFESKQQKEIKFDFLDKVIYSCKGQFELDHKNKQLNLLLSLINPKDSYGKTADSKTLFMKISRPGFDIVSQKEMTNHAAVAKALTDYPDMALNNNSFANFPQVFYTDSAGNNTFLFQTVYNNFNTPDGTCTYIRQEFAFEYADANAEINAVQLYPYRYAEATQMTGSLDEFAFQCNTYKQPRAPRFYSFDEDYYHFKTFETGNKKVVILNQHPKNIGKSMAEKLIGHTEKDMQPMILIAGKNFSVFEKVFKESKYDKLIFNVNMSSYNKNTKTYSVIATELKGSKEKLVWIKF